MRLDCPRASARYFLFIFDKNDEYAHEDTSSNHTRVDGMKTYRNEIVPFDAIRLTKRSLPELVFTVRIFHHHPVAEPSRCLYLVRIRDRRSSCRSWGLVAIRSSARSPSSCFHGAYGADRTRHRAQEDIIEMQALEEEDVGGVLVG